MASSLPRGLVSHHPAVISAGLDVAADEPVDVELVAKLWRVYAASSATLNPESAAPRLVNLLWRVWSGGHGQCQCHCHCRSKNRPRSNDKLEPTPRANISGATLARLFLRISDEAGAGSGSGSSGPAIESAPTSSPGRPSLPQRSNSRGSGTGKPLTPILKKARPVPPPAAAAAAAAAVSDTAAASKSKKDKNERVSFPGRSASSHSSSSSIEGTADAGTEDHPASPPRANGPRVVGSSPRKRTAFATSLASLGEEPPTQQQQQLHSSEAPAAPSSASRRTQYKHDARKQPSLQETEAWPFEKAAPTRPTPPEKTTRTASTVIDEAVRSSGKPAARAKAGKNTHPAHDSSGGGIDKSVIVEKGFGNKRSIEKQQPRQQQTTPHHHRHQPRPTTTPSPGTTQPRSIRSSLSATSSSNTVPSAASTIPTTVPASASTSTTTISRSNTSLSSSRGPAPSQLSRLLESERGK